MHTPLPARPWDPLSREQKLDLLAANTSYALRWLEDCEDPDNTRWIGGALDTLAHQVACCLCQWFDLEGVPTSETRDYLELEKFPSQETLRFELEAYLNLYEAHRNLYAPPPLPVLPMETTPVEAVDAPVKLVAVYDSADSDVAPQVWLPRREAHRFALYPLDKSQELGGRFPNTDPADITLLEAGSNARFPDYIQLP